MKNPKNHSKNIHPYSLKKKKKEKTHFMRKKSTRKRSKFYLKELSGFIINS